MHQPTAPVEVSNRGVFDGVTPYHWLVVVIASCGWLFDCMDQRIFLLGREPALRELLGNDPQAAAHIRTMSGYATTSMILGWATGGIIFGMMSDRLGRVKTMVITLLIYSGFTGLSGLATTWVDFTIYRFLVGLGVGGMFGAATTLVAESVPSQFRAVALGSLQALSALGNIMGSLASLMIPPGAAAFAGGYSGWRVLFFVGIIPSLLVVPIMFVLKEPDSWLRARAEAAAGRGTGKSIGSPLELFRQPRWRHNTIVGLLLGVSGMIGLWGIGFFSPELISTALRGESQPVVDRVRALGTALQDVGSFFGMMTFTLIASFLSRRLAFLIALLLSMAVTMFVFASLHSASDAYWMLPMMGFAQLGLFAGYSIYFPELFPTRLRGTGVGFCYNTVRYLAAPAPILFGYLATRMSFREAAISMAGVYLIGTVALIWAPETKGQPLPED
ncbi:MAG TPA: MFS transporter [Vicinamibacterales bacterium]|nr:MFS transporter [Vicinamibacterales bacterium]